MNPVSALTFLDNALAEYVFFCRSLRSWKEIAWVEPERGALSHLRLTFFVFHLVFFGLLPTAGCLPLGCILIRARPYYALEVTYALWASLCDLRDPGWGDPGFWHCWSFVVFYVHRDLAVWSDWMFLCFLQDPIHILLSLAHKLPCLRYCTSITTGCFRCFCFVFVCFCLVFCFFVWLFFWVVFFRSFNTPLGTWTAYWSALSFDSPMREYTGLCTIRSMAQTLCYDLARAEKAKDGKKRGVSAHWAQALAWRRVGKAIPTWKWRQRWWRRCWRRRRGG